MSWIPVFSKSCVMCTGRTTEGDKPNCAHNRPTEAMWYGDLEDESSEIFRKVEDLRDRDFRLFRLPGWENSKEGIVYVSTCLRVYASKRS